MEHAALEATAKATAHQSQLEQEAEAHADTQFQLGAANAAAATAKAKAAAIRDRALAVTGRTEAVLEDVEARLLDARLSWETEHAAGRRRRQEDRELMIDQCRQWEATLEGAAEALERHAKGHDELKFRSLAFCSATEKRVRQLQQHLLAQGTGEEGAAAGREEEEEEEEEQEQEQEEQEQEEQAEE